MLQLLFLAVFFLIIAFYIRNSIVRAVFSVFAAISVLLQSISFFMQGVPINEVFLSHFDSSSLKIAFIAYKAYTFFGLLLVVGLIALFYFAHKIKNRIHSKKIHIFAILVLAIACIALSDKSGIFYKTHKLFYNIYEMNAHHISSMDEIFEKQGVDYRRFVPREEIKAIPGKNVVIILLESYEAAFFDNSLFDNLTPNFQRLRNEMTYYKLDGRHNKYLSFGALYSLMTGNPYSLFSHNEFFSTVDSSTLMPGLGDVFKAAGYSMKTLLAAPDFSGTEKFLKLYHFDVMGRQSDLPDNAKFHAWGAYDHDIFELAKREYIQMSNEGEPFVLQIFTIDTHHPLGYYDDRFPKMGDGSDLEAAVYITDYLVNDFIEFLKEQDNYNNTALFILADHPCYGNVCQARITNQERDMFLFTNIEPENYSVSENDTLFFPNIPRMILEGSSIKSNVFFMGDLFKRKNKESLYEVIPAYVNFINKAMWRVFVFNNDIAITKEIKGNTSRFKLTNADGNTFYTDFARRGNTHRLEFRNNLPHKLTNNWSPEYVHLSLMDTQSNFSAYLGNYNDIGVYLPVHGGSALMKYEDYVNIVGSQKLRSNRSFALNITSKGAPSSGTPSSVNNKAIPNARGITVIYRGPNNLIMHKSFDTHSFPEATVSFNKLLQQTFLDNTFVGMYVFDEGSTQLAPYREYYKRFGLHVLASLGYRESYIAVKLKSGLIYEIKDVTGNPINFTRLGIDGNNSGIAMTEKTTLPVSRGLSLITNTQNGLLLRSYDTYAFEEDAARFMTDITEAIKNKTFLSMYVFDEASLLLSKFSDELREIGLFELANLAYRGGYIAYNSEKRIVEVSNKEEHTPFELDLILLGNYLYPLDQNNVDYAEGILNIVSHGYSTLNGVKLGAKEITERSPFWRKQYDKSLSRADYMIAHAGGMIDKAVYTNSAEAVAQSLKKGYKFIEIDMQITKDGYIIAAHDAIDNITLAEFMEKKINNTFSPISYAEINEVMLQNQDLVLVTDKIRDFDKLKEQIFYPERMIVEVFSHEDYKKAIEYGFKYPAFCVWDYIDPSYIIDNDIKMITATGKFIIDYPHLAMKLHEAGVAILTFTINDKKIFQTNAGRTSSLFYTDMGF